MVFEFFDRILLIFVIFTLFGTFAIAILGIYPDAPGKGSPCVLRLFSAGPGCFGFFLQILPIFVTFLHFSSILPLAILCIYPDAPGKGSPGIS